MTKEALKLALEALEDLGMKHYESTGEVLYKETSTAIKEALAQLEQECFLVATIGNWGRVEWADGVSPSLGDKMYSAPPQRTWVGLTKEERHEISMANRPYCADIMAAHEEELKRRNT